MTRLYGALLAFVALGYSTAASADWTGPYLGADAGYMWGETRVVDTGVLVEPGAKTDGAIGGLLGGYNWQDGRWVYGADLDGSIASVSGHGATSSGLKYDLHWASNVRLRVGTELAPGTLIFAAGGLALTDLRFHETGMMNCGVTRPGWTIGGGVEEALSDNLAVRVEYLYADYGTVRYNMGPSDYYNVGFKASTLRGGLVWMFN